MWALCVCVSYEDRGTVGVTVWWDVRVTSRLDITRSLPASDIVGNSVGGAGRERERDHNKDSKSA